MTAQNSRLESKTALQAYLEESITLERDLVLEKERSKKTAWRVAGFCMILAFLGLLAGIAGLSQESPAPVVLRVDNTTGAVEPVSVQQETETSYGEVVDSYFLNKYILNREGYQYLTIQSMYDVTRLLSSGEAWDSYNALYSGPNARDASLGNSASITVSVRSITSNSQNGIATIRYSTQKKNSNGIIEPVQHWIATVSYTYVRALMTTEERRINPLGFVVTTFRADPEVIRN